MTVTTRTLLNGRVKIGYNQQTYPNETVLEIAPQLRPCEDCHAMVDRLVTANWITTPFPHWRVTCKTCNMIQNPDTGVFEFDSVNEANRYLRAKYPLKAK